MANSSLVTVFRKKKDKLAMRDAYYEDKVDSTRLVPGDIIYINPDEKVPCDLILLDGQALIDESLLTGESVPMLKTPVPRNEALFSDQNKEYIIYAGTYAITSVSSTNKDQPAKAMVFQIGFGTTKGRLIRSIMFNDPAMYRFERDSNYFTLYLFMIASCFVIAYYYICFTIYPKDERDYFQIFFPSCDIVLTMVPPGLSLSLSIGIQYSQTRLRNGQIMALKGRLINAAGRMKAMFFDKTGTLTINEMKLHNVIMNSDSWRKGKPAELIDLEHGKGTSQATVENKQAYTNFVQHFATNHSLSYIKGKILGDPMEDELFKYANAAIADDQNEAEQQEDFKYFKKIRILNQKDQQSVRISDVAQLLKKSMHANFTEAEEEQMAKEARRIKPMYVLAILDFKPQLQRMSVIVKNSADNSWKVFCKGAPEKVIKLCRPETLPENLDDVVKHLAKNGYRILAFGSKDLEAEASLTNSRDSYESDLNFQGLAIFKNNLKDMTKPTIENLKRADFKVGMITGDNINTAVSIAKNCRLVDTSREDRKSVV